MTTIPIEVIVQDKASPEPTPTPSDSGETNIVVPDTGAGTVENGSNGGGIGSVVSIILPAIILVLAIGVIVALLVRRQQGRKNNTSTDISKKEKLATVASGTIAILAATVLVGNLVIPVTSAATNVEPGTAELDTVDKITITATREIDSDITVATVKNTSYATANLDFGYKVTAGMIEGATTANLYLNGDETSEYYIAPVTHGTLTDNAWGYTLEEPSEDTTYLPIPLEDTPATITKGNDMVEDEAVDIYYAIKVDKDMPAGSYIGELEYNISEQNPIDSLTYMQDFNTLSTGNKTAVLNSMIEDKQYYLIDSRDNKTYRIAKLKDGKVWMTQNLDLQKEDLLPNVVLDNSNTDNLADGFMMSDSQTGGSESWGDDEVSVNTSHIYDTANDGEEHYSCIEYQPWGPCKTYSDEPIPSVELGNLYNWYAATAGTGTYSLTSGEATGSLCPAGWKLPSYQSGVSDYANMLYPYGIISEPTSSTIDKPSEMLQDPLLFIKAGYYSSGAAIGTHGDYWTSSSIDDSARNLMIGSSNFINVYSKKSSGRSVRCLVR